MNRVNIKSERIYTTASAVFAALEEGKMLSYNNCGYIIKMVNREVVSYRYDGKWRVDSEAFYEASHWTEHETFFTLMYGPDFFEVEVLVERKRLESFGEAALQMADGHTVVGRLNCRLPFKTYRWENGEMLYDASDTASSCWMVSDMTVEHAIRSEWYEV